LLIDVTSFSTRRWSASLLAATHQQHALHRCRRPDRCRRSETEVLLPDRDRGEMFLDQHRVCRPLRPMCWRDRPSDLIMRDLRAPGDGAADIDGAPPTLMLDCRRPHSCGSVTPLAITCLKSSQLIVLVLPPQPVTSITQARPTRLQTPVLQRLQVHHAVSSAARRR